LPQLKAPSTGLFGLKTGTSSSLPIPGSTLPDMNAAHLGQVGSAFSLASKPSFVFGSGWMSLLGLLYLRSAPSSPWHVRQSTVLNFFASNVWTIGFIVGTTAAFMYVRFCSN